MPPITKLSSIANEINDLIRGKYTGKTFWITAEVSGIRKYLNKRCYLDFTEKTSLGDVTMCGVIWEENYSNIELFESSTNTEFKNGIEITCKVSVTYYKQKNCPQLRVLEIDFAHAVGQLELERQKTIKKLLAENKSINYLPDGRYRTNNNVLPLPKVIQRIALITSPNSDGQRDFKEVIKHNPHGYVFAVKEYLTQVQGNSASQLILNQLKLIEKDKGDFDIVAVVRGGGSDMDFAAFNDYNLAKYAALFCLPILTGIGHDRNTSIVDLMCTQLRTPTEVAKFLIERNRNIEDELQELQERFFQALDDLIYSRKDTIQHFKQRVKNLHPSTILKKGFAIITSNNKIVTDPKTITINSEINAILKNEVIHSKVTKKSRNEKQFDI